MDETTRHYEQLFVKFLHKTNAFIDKYIETETILRKEISDLRASIKELHEKLNNNKIKQNLSNNIEKSKHDSNKSSPRLSLENEILTDEHIAAINQQQAVETVELNNVNSVNLTNTILDKLTNIEKTCPIVSKANEVPVINDVNHLTEESTIVNERVEEQTTAIVNNDNDSEVPSIEQNKEDKLTNDSDESDNDENLGRLCNFDFLNSRKKKQVDYNEEDSQENEQEFETESKKKQAKSLKKTDDEIENLIEDDLMTNQGNFIKKAFLITLKIKIAI